MINAYLFRVLILEPLQLLACLLVVESLTLQLRLKAAVLRLQNLYLRFRLSQSVKRKRKTLADYVRYRKVLEGVSSGVNEAYNVDARMMPNAPAQRPGGNAVKCETAASSPGSLQPACSAIWLS